MQGKLRDDLFARLLEWEQRCDLCLALGTSLSGMNADRVATTPARKARGQQTGGLVIINLQQTQYDNLCSLRIFSTLDHAFGLLTGQLGIVVPETAPRIEFSEHVFSVPYDAEGQRDLDNPPRILDLRDGAKVRVTSGRYGGAEGEVDTRNKEGHYKLRVMVTVKGSFKAPFVLVLGKWIVREAVEGLLEKIPIVSCEQQ
eukprot:c15538_g1_i1.p1 GENE.c15538_g1_i1~~c15538_g1_i1.p1  ORF type:complete len:200 (-),score=40.46 c15538_g1_i1:23-622(-)